MNDGGTTMETETVGQNKGLYEDLYREGGRQRLSSPTALRQIKEVAAGGSSAGAVAGVGAGVLAILGLAGTLPLYMMTIAIIAIGVGLVAEGISLRSALVKIDRQIIDDHSLVAGSFGFESMAGTVGIVLGILSLLGLLPGILIPIAIIGVGGAMAFVGPIRAELDLNALETGKVNQTVRRLAAQALNTSGGLWTLTGLAAVTLGILALLHFPGAPVLVLVALLGLGSALFLGDVLLLCRVGLLGRVATMTSVTH